MGAQDYNVGTGRLLCLEFNIESGRDLQDGPRGVRWAPSLRTGNIKVADLRALLAFGNT